MERKLLEKKMQVVLALVSCVFILLIFRLGYMQIYQGDQYQTLARQNHIRLINITAPRGEIRDRNDVRIVGNRPVYTVSLAYLGLEDTERVVRRLAGILKDDPSFRDISREQIVKTINDKIGSQQLRLYEPLKVAEDVDAKTVTKIEEMRIDLPGVLIDVEPLREYISFADKYTKNLQATNSGRKFFLMPQTLGYVREINAEELEKYKDDGYQLGDNFGKTGLEREYEFLIRGERGARQVEVDAQARPVRDLGIKPPVPGNNLIMTVDHRLQLAAQVALENGIKQAHANGYAPGNKITSGAVVVQDVRNGEILAMASLPDYDPNIFTGLIPTNKMKVLLESGALKNHAVQSIYTPGSTFKMVSAASFLEKGIVTPSTSISDPGYIRVGNLLKNDWKRGGHGTVDVYKALEQSCDTYFYTFGTRAGPDLMGMYARKFGLGEKTGIDLPAGIEEAGVVASKEHKKEVWAGNEWESQWHAYDSMDMAIGQQENKYTALQLSNYVAAIANGGKLYKPHLVKKIVSPDGQVVKDIKPQLIREVGVSDKNLAILREGMRRVASPGGTASLLAGRGYNAAAKTGTAEVLYNGKMYAHALFVAFAPYDKPEISVSVVVEFGGKGSGIAGPVAREILDTYFALKKAPPVDPHALQDQEVQQNQPEQQTRRVEPGSRPQVTPAVPGNSGASQRPATGRPQGATGQRQTPAAPPPAQPPTNQTPPPGTGASGQNSGSPGTGSSGNTGGQAVPPIPPAVTPE